jgi:siroheme synthase-like protein
MTHLLPIFLKLTGRRCVVIEVGQVGAQKISGLLEMGVEVIVIEPSPSQQLRTLAEEHKVRVHERRYELSGLENAFLVIAATSEPETNQRIFTEARHLGVLANVVDVPDLCDFYYPAIVRRGPLAISVSSQRDQCASAQGLGPYRCRDGSLATHHSCHLRAQCRAAPASA